MKFGRFWNTPKLSYHDVVGILLLPQLALTFEPYVGFIGVTLIIGLMLWGWMEFGKIMFGSYRAYEHRQEATAVILTLLETVHVLWTALGDNKAKVDKAVPEMVREAISQAQQFRETWNK